MWLCAGPIDCYPSNISGFGKHIKEILLCWSGLTSTLLISRWSCFSCSEGWGIYITSTPCQPRIRIKDSATSLSNLILWCFALVTPYSAALTCLQWPQRDQQSFSSSLSIISHLTYSYFSNINLSSNFIPCWLLECFFPLFIVFRTPPEFEWLDFISVQGGISLPVSELTQVPVFVECNLLWRLSTFVLFSLSCILFFYDGLLVFSFGCDKISFRLIKFGDCLPLFEDIILWGCILEDVVLWKQVW